MMRWHELSHGNGITQMLAMEPRQKLESVYQKIETFDHPFFGRVLSLDGTVQVSQAEEFVYHELAVHIPLLGRLREDAQVLIVGGGDGGMLREVLRHPHVKRAVMVEIDADVIELSNSEIQIQGDYADPRVELVVGDAVDWLRNAAQRGNESFDLVIIDATDSTSPSKFLWNHEFYGNISRCLAPTGVCVDSDILILGKDGARMSRDPCDLGIFEMLQSQRHFSSVECYYTKAPLYPGGYFVFFLYTKDGWSYAEPKNNFSGVHYNPELHRAAFALPVWWKKRMADLGSTWLGAQSHRSSENKANAAAQIPSFRQLLIELYGCTPEALGPAEGLKALKAALTKSSGGSKGEEFLQNLGEEAWSGIITLNNAQLWARSFPELRYVSIDIWADDLAASDEEIENIFAKAMQARSSSLMKLPRANRDRILAGLAGQDKQNAAATRLHPALYEYNELFIERYIDPSVAAPRREKARSCVREIAEQVYKFQLFTPLFCKHLIEEAEHANAWRTVREKMEEPHSSLPGIVDVYEPETIVSFEAMPGLSEVYDAIVSRHVQPIIEGLWPTFRLQQWDPAGVRKFEPTVVAGMGLHYDSEIVGMIGYLSAAFKGGGTYFPRWDLTVGDSESVEPGSVIVYPGGVSHEHSARPVLEGQRYMLSNSFY